MKKLLSILVAVCILASGSIVAFAKDTQSKTDKVTQQINGAVEYLTAGVTAYGVDDAVSYYTLVKSGVLPDEYNDAFLSDVKANLDANGGRIVSSYGESLATYGAIISILDELCEDPADFYGYNIIDAFTAIDPAQPQASPYYYRAIIPATLYCDDTFAGAVCEAFINNNYTMGQGMAFYGYYSCDNTAYFITALSEYADVYPEVIEDAFSVLETYCKDGGYFSDNIYVTEPNTDSTALALMAYSSVLFSVDDDNLDAYFEKVNSIYDNLCTFEGSKTGVFISSYTDDDDLYATMDALMGLEEYYYVAMLQDLNEQDIVIDNESITDEAEVAIIAGGAPEAEAPVKSPATGADINAVTLIVSLMGAAAFTAIIYKRRQIEITRCL